MRSRFDSELEALNHELLEMGNLIENNIKSAIKSVEDDNKDLALMTIENDKEVNEMEKIIERRALSLLLKQQPVASDLRFISSSLKMITDMERIGDIASDIANIVYKSEKLLYIDEPKYITIMGDSAINIVKRSLESFLNKDTSLVKDVIEYDKIINKSFNDLKLSTIKTLKETDGNEEGILDYLLIGKYLEKTGDHAKNIAKWVYFSIEGKHIKR